MTEAEWQACAAVDRMLKEVRPAASERQHRLLAVAFARRVWDRIALAESRDFIEIVERYADGLASWNDLLTARAAAVGASDAPDRARFCSALLGLSLTEAPEGFSALGASHAARSLVAAAGTPGRQALVNAEQRAQCDLVRDVFGPPPFRPAAADPAWLAWNAGTVPELARAIYAEHRFADLPVLADALQDAGCNREAILTHCRQPGAHVRGCWVLDLLLGQE